MVTYRYMDDARLALAWQDDEQLERSTEVASISLLRVLATLTH